MAKKKFVVGVVGATGAVGTRMVEVLAERNFPVEELYLFASARSKGKTVEFRGEKLVVNELREDDFADYARKIDIFLFSAGASVSKKFAPIAAREGAVVIDNSSAWRMDPDVPLVVPEVNPHAAQKHQGIIANPNCSTIQMVVVLKPLHDYAKVKRVVVATYQAVSGTGLEAMAELREQSLSVLEGREVEKKVYPHQIAFNVLPHIDIFMDNLYTKEEMKMVNETRKIMEDESIRVSPTAVRVPVFIGHSEAVNIEFEKFIDVPTARKILSRAPGVVVVDNPEKNEYPLPVYAAGKDEVFVGRIRQDETVSSGLNLWIVADNLRKGAATNAVQIAELIVKNGWLPERK